MNSGDHAGGNWGSRGRRFKSGQPDQRKPLHCRGFRRSAGEFRDAGIAESPRKVRGSPQKCGVEAVGGCHVETLE